MEKLLETSLDQVLRWDALEHSMDLLGEGNGNNSSRYAHNRPEQQLHRDYIKLFGMYPKMEDRIYSCCEVCEQVFDPHTAATHKEYCSGKGKIQVPHLKKKVKSKKKMQNLSLPLPPLFKTDTSEPPVLQRFSELPPPLPSPSPPAPPSPNATPVEVNPPALSSEVNGHVSVRNSSPKLISEASESVFPNSAPNSPSTPPAIITSEDDLTPVSSSGSKHKKLKKTSKSTKEYDPDVHCGVIEGQKGPCTRSITCSNHKIQLRKSVPGRSKDIHVLISERKSSKEKDSHRHLHSPSQCSSHERDRKPSKDYNLFLPQLVEATPIDYQGQNVIEDMSNYKATATRVPPIMKIADNDLHDDSEIDDSSNQLESGYCSIETNVSSTKSSPIIYYNPISPIFVVTPVQFVQKENNMYVEKNPQPVLSSSLPSGSYFIIPEQTSNIKFYKSLPKPFGGRKLGGSILTSNQRLEYQRNDIEVAITKKRKATSTPSCKSTYNVPAPRAILLKTKNLNKVSCKRTSTERPSSSSSDSKQIRLATDVNGFILHTDMSDVADTPHYCIQENIINLLNMK